MGEKLKFKACCEAWSHANDEGTDGEGFGSLIWYTEFDDDLRPYTSVLGDPPAVSELPPLRYCPWCGARKDA